MQYLYVERITVVLIGNALSQGIKIPKIAKSSLRYFFIENIG